MAETKSTYVLVHGAWHGAWCYRRVAAALRARGHEVHAPTLTGLAERSHQIVGVNLSTHITDIVQLLRWEDLTDVVLVGHSYAGMVITGVVAQAPERVRSVVYVDAYLPAEGQNMLDMVPEPIRSSFTDAAASHGGLVMPAPPAELLAVNPADRAWVDARCTPHPYASFLERVAGRDAVERVGKRTYIYASGWGTTPFTAIHEQLKGAPGWTVHSTECGHDVMIDVPERLVELLIAAA